MLAVAIGVFAATYSETWHRSQVDQAAYAAGADVLVDPSERGGAPPTIDLGSSYRALGATAALPAVTDSFDFAAAGGATGNLSRSTPAERRESSGRAATSPRARSTISSVRSQRAAAGWPPWRCPAGRRGWR